VPRRTPSTASRGNGSREGPSPARFAWGFGVSVKLACGGREVIGEIAPLRATPEVTVDIRSGVIEMYGEVPRIWPSEEELFL
jgi:hypothetical protein